MDKLKKSNGGAKFVKQLLLVNSNDDFAAMLYSCICTRRSFDGRVGILTSFLRRKGYFFIPFQIKMELGDVLFKRSEPTLSGCACWSEEGKKLVESIFYVLETAGYGTTNPSEEEQKKIGKQTVATELSEEAKAYLAQPSACYF